MWLSLILIALVTPAPHSSSAWTANKPAVRQAVFTRHGAHTQIDSILIKRGYALVHGTGFHDVLQRSGKTWKTTCDLNNTNPDASVLESRCDVPSAIATSLAAEEPVNLLAGQGNFSGAVAAEQSVGASVTQSYAQSVRLQQLRTLNEQMQLQQITRSQAIQQWSQLDYSWALP